MIKKMNAIKARQNLGQLLEEVSSRGEHYIIERAGKPMAALVPVWRVEAWQQRREQFFAMIDAVREANQEVPPEVIEHEVAEAVEQVRREAGRRQP